MSRHCLLRGRRSSPAFLNRLNPEAPRGRLLRNCLELNYLSLLPTNYAWGHAGYPTEVSGQVALVGESRRQCDLRHRKISIPKHVLRVFNAALEHIVMRRHTHGLLEGTCEMVQGQPRHFGESFEAYVLVEIGLNVFADAVRTPWRESRTIER